MSILTKQEIVERLLDMQFYLEDQEYKEQQSLEICDCYSNSEHLGRRDVFKEVKEYLKNNFNPLIGGNG